MALMVNSELTFPKATYIGSNSGTLEMGNSSLILVGEGLFLIR